MTGRSQKAKKKSAAANALWGGRFDAAPGAVMEEINASIDFDKKMFAQDIAGSKAHCAMLIAQGIIPAEDGNAILAGLDTILGEMEAAAFLLIGRSKIST